MICALSGEPVVDAVVSPRSGAIFERKLIETYISTAGKDPINDEPLSSLDLISLAVPAAITPPKPPSFSSIPTMLAAFQNEWDALALETYTLRKQLNNALQELSAALYKYEAAVRVAARITKERDDAQEALAKLAETLALDGTDAISVDSSKATIKQSSKVLNSNASKENKSDSAYANTDVVEESSFGNEATNGTKIEENNTTISDERMDESRTPDYSDPKNVPVDLLLKAREKLFAVHKKMKISLPITKSSKASIKIANSDSHDLPGLVDVIYDSTMKKSLCRGSFGVTLIPDNINSADAYAGAFLSEDESSTPFVLTQGHFTLLEQNVTKSFPLDQAKLLATHPSEALFVAVTSTNQWALADVNGLIYISEPLEKITHVAFHVDGILLALAREGGVDIYDITSTQKVSTIGVNNGQITDVQFALNGFWILVSSVNDQNEGRVDVYDLRKSVLVQNIAFASPVLFAIDPSSLVLLTYETASKKVAAHIYSKKGKTWIENAGELEAGDITKLIVESTAEEVNESKTLTVAGYGTNQIEHYSIELI